MSTRSPDAAKVYVLALILPWAAVLPTLGYGFTREDWLFLWAALDPQTAPDGVTGSFFRPVAFGLWRVMTAVAGDHPLGMHAAMLILASVLVLGLVRLLLRLGITSTLAILMSTVVVGSHAALVELRLWASASNGLLAGAAGVWGAALLLLPRWRILGALLLVLAAAARTDAWFLWAAPLILAWDAAPAGRRGWLVAAGLALMLLLAWMHLDAWSGFRLAHTGELARRLFLPWGPAMAPGLSTALGAAVLVVLLAGVVRLRDVTYRIACALVLLPLLAAAFVPWTPAGRYLLVPALGLSIAAGRWTAGRRVGPVLPLVVWACANLGSNWIGTTARDLWQRGSAEVSLYRALQDVGVEGDEVVLVDAPPMGWRGEPADAENVASVAARRPVTVHLVDSASPKDPRTVLAYVNGHWRLVR